MTVMRMMTADDHSVDYLVNVEGYDQLLASRLVYGPRNAPSRGGPTPPDPRTATPEAHRVWVRAWIRHAAVAAFGAALALVIDATPPFLRRTP